MPPALLEILVKAVACGGRGEDNAALRAFCRFPHCLLHIPRMDNVYLEVYYKRAYAFSAVGQQNNVLNNSRIEKISENIIGDTSVHSAENKAVGVVAAARATAIL